jgi:hypothetical protein
MKLNITQELADIIRRSFSETLTKKEQETLMDWLQQNSIHQEWYNSLLDNWEEDVIALEHLNLDDLWRKIQSKKSPSKPIPRLIKWLKVSIVASFFIFTLSFFM